MKQAAIVLLIYVALFGTGFLTAMHFASKWIIP
jgi:hypothetical protein